MYPCSTVVYIKNFIRNFRSILIEKDSPSGLPRVPGAAPFCSHSHLSPCFRDRTAFPKCLQAPSQKRTDAAAGSPFLPCFRFKDILRQKIQVRCAVNDRLMQRHSPAHSVQKARSPLQCLQGCSSSLLLGHFLHSVITLSAPLYVLDSATQAELSYRG